MDLAANLDTMQIARDAYHAYGDTTDWKNFKGDPMPRFDELPPKIRDAWHAATVKAIDSYERATTVTQPDRPSSKPPGGLP